MLIIQVIIPFAGLFKFVQCCQVDRAQFRDGRRPAD